MLFGHRLVRSAGSGVLCGTLMLDISTATYSTRAVTTPTMIFRSSSQHDVTSENAEPGPLAAAQRSGAPKKGCPPSGGTTLAPRREDISRVATRHQAMS